MKKNQTINYTQRYTFFGVLLGMCFPIFSLLLDGLFFKNLPFDAYFIGKVHHLNPIHFVIDTAPIVLGFSFGIAGSIAQKLYLFKLNLETIVDKRTHELQASQEELQASDEELRQNLEELQATQDALFQQKNELEAQTAFQQAILDNADVIIISTNHEGIITGFNQKAEELLRYTAAELLYQASPALFHVAEEVEEAARQLSEELGYEVPVGFEVFIARSKAGLANVKEWTYIPKTGKRFYVSLSVSIIKDIEGQSLGYLGIAQDITARKRHERSIHSKNEMLMAHQQESEKMLAELFHAKHQLTAQRDELEGTLKNLQETQTQLIHAEKMASLGQLVASIAHEINTPLGAVRSTVGSIAYALEEILMRLPAFLLDLPITDRQVFLGLLQNAIQHQDVPLSSREARKIRSEIAQVLAEKNIPQAQDLAELLVEIKIQDLTPYTELLACAGAAKLIEMVYHFISIQRGTTNIQTATERAAKIIFALKNFSRQDHTGEKTLTNLNESIETVLTIYHNQLKQGIEVSRHFEDLPAILCYPDELIQVWTNLIHNAMQAMNGKGNLTLATRQEAGKVIVSIQDSGQGIPEEIQSKIFNPFFTTKKIGEGSGLGLDIVKKIVEKHEGEIYFNTVPQAGTTFFVALPAVS